MKKIAVAMLALALSACAGSGSIKWDNVRQLQVGMTEKEVVEKVGRPYRVSGKGDGTEVWVWVYVNTMTGSNESMSVIMKDGKATSVPKVPDSFK
jgi:outer membrane protein assembly factor BamE (lipoprotein component of BamABCDE complex)